MATYRSVVLYPILQSHCPDLTIHSSQRRSQRTNDVRRICTHVVRFQTSKVVLELTLSLCQDLDLPLSLGQEYVERYEDGVIGRARGDIGESKGPTHFPVDWFVIGGGSVEDARKVR